MGAASDDLRSLVLDTVREALRSWRLPASLALGVGFGLLESKFTGRRGSFFFGPGAALYTLLLAPLPWRALLPLEEDGRRAEKALRALAALAAATILFSVLVATYRAFASAAHMREVYAFGARRELLVTWLLFIVGGWGLARDIQLEQRLDRTLGSHERIAAELAAARLDAVRADLDPHFLFNALNAIASQCASDPAAAEQNVCRLATLLRAVLDTRRRALHPLDDELALAHDYLELLRARYPALRFDVRASDDALCVDVPPLVLQPLLENAVRHGRVELGAVTLSAARDGDDLRMEVSSPGTYAGPREGGMGLDLVRRRVALAWGDRGRFEVRNEGERAVASIVARGAAAPRHTAGAHA
ncbi:MAG: histidine kinase [Polyangiales bacterium]